MQFFYVLSGIVLSISKVSQYNILYYLVHRKEIKEMTRYEKILLLWKKKNIKTEAELSEVLNSHSISFAYHSGRIENEKVTYNDTREIFEHDGVTAYTGDLRTLFELRNARDAYELLLSSFTAKKVLDVKLVKDFHYELTKNTYDARRWQLGERPGEFKKHDYVTGKDEIGASPAEAPEELSELLEELVNLPAGKELIAAAYFHAKFENIHPFADGNGRTGRIIMNYFLLVNGHPPIIIHEDDRKQYYSCLESWDEKQDLDPLVDFLRIQTEKTWEKQLSRDERNEYER